MSLKLSGATLAPLSGALRVSRTRPERAVRAPRRWWSVVRDPGLDDRLLRDIGLSRADMAALLL